MFSETDLIRNLNDELLNVYEDEYNDDDDDGGAVPRSAKPEVQHNKERIPFDSVPIRSQVLPSG